MYVTRLISDNSYYFFFGWSLLFSLLLDIFVESFHGIELMPELEHLQQSLAVVMVSLEVTPVCLKGNGEKVFIKWLVESIVI